MKKNNTIDYNIYHYLETISKRGVDSEIALYAPLSQYIIKGVLGYDPAREISINKREAEGVPDVQIISPFDRKHWRLQKRKWLLSKKI